MTLQTPARDTADARLTAPDTLTLTRRLPGPIERVWRYLTDSELRRQWLASGEMSLQPGSSFELVWRNDELTQPPGQRPEGFSAESRATCRLLQADPPRQLQYDWSGVGEVTFQLEPAGEGEVLLTIVHRRLPNRGMSLNVASGWHAHTDVLAARLAGAPDAASFWDNWQRLHAEYGRKL